MTLPTKWKTRDEAPEWARDDLKEVNGEFYLDVAGYRPAAEFDDFRQKNLDLTRKLEELQRQREGGLSPEEAAKKEEEIEELRRKLEEGAHGERVEELIEQRLGEIELGDRKIKVLRTDLPHVKAQLKATGEKATKLTDETTVMRRELETERLEGGTRAAMSRIGGFKEPAHDDVVLHVRTVARLDEKFQPYIPDLEQDPEGKTPLVGEDGKPVRIEGYLRQIQEKGTKSGVWFEDPSGPTRRNLRPTSTTGQERGSATGQRRIAKGLRKQKGSQAAS